ncbi:hypothetical protein D3C86_1870970 [compost metagenome]
MQAVGIELFHSGQAAGLGQRRRQLVARRQLPDRAQRRRRAAVLALLARGQRLGRLALMAQRGFEAPVLPAIFLKNEQAVALGFGRLHIGFLAHGAELAVGGLQAKHAAQARNRQVLDL